MDDDRRFLKVNEVAERLSLDASTVYKMLRSGALPSVRIGPKAVRVPAEALEGYLRRAAVDNAGRDDLSDDEPTELSEVLQDRLSAFILRTGLNPFAFVEGWKDGTIEDTAENAVLAIEAVALRSAIESPSPRAIRSLVRRPYHEK